MKADCTIKIKDVVHRGKIKKFLPCEQWIDSDHLTYATYHAIVHIDDGRLVNLPIYDITMLEEVE
jgi:hypothetical protein